MIRNVHSRSYTCSPAALGALLDGLGSPGDRLWPFGAWPRLRLDQPLRVGSAGGHGPVRYTMTAYVPGSLAEFRFDPSMFVVGTHTFEVLPGSSVLRHELVGRPVGVRGALLWSLVFRPLHDACLEDLLDRAGAAVGSPPARPSRWSPYVRLLRSFPGRRRPAPVAVDSKSAG